MIKKKECDRLETTNMYHNQENVNETETYSIKCRAKHRKMEKSKTNTNTCYDKESPSKL